MGYSNGLLHNTVLRFFFSSPDENIRDFQAAPEVAGALLNFYLLKSVFPGILILAACYIIILKIAKLSEIKKETDLRFSLRDLEENYYQYSKEEHEDGYFALNSLEL